MRLRLATALLALALGSPRADAALTGKEIVGRSLLAFYYQGNDLKARAKMDLIDSRGGRRTRVLTMVRRDQSEGGNQKYFLYFHEPGDVRGVSFLVWKYPEKDDDRWIFMPALDAVRRVSANDKRASFVGSDFTYEDISGRDAADDSHQLLREAALDGRNCYVVESKPARASDHARRVSWIDRSNFLPLKEEYYDRGDALLRRFTADQIREISGGNRAYPTVMKRTMTNVKTGRRTEVTFTSVSYDLGLRDADFTERSLRQPPAAWIR